MSYDCDDVKLYLNTAFLIRKFYLQIETEVENSPQVLELQKRVKVLQGKLDKEKEHAKTLSESLKARQKTTDTPGGAIGGGAKGLGAGTKTLEGASAGDKPSAVDSRVCGKQFLDSIYSMS